MARAKSDKPARAKRIRRGGRGKKVVAQGPYDSSWVKDFPIRKFSGKIQDCPWRASTPLERENGNPPRTCGDGYAFVGKMTRPTGERRWVFSFPTREERNRFVERCHEINGCHARRELSDPTTW